MKPLSLVVAYAGLTCFQLSASSITSAATGSVGLTVCDPNAPLCVPVNGSMSDSGAAAAAINLQTTQSVPGSTSNVFGYGAVSAHANANFGRLFANNVELIGGDELYFRPS